MKFFKTSDNSKEYSLDTAECAEITSELLGINEIDLEEVIDIDSLEDIYNYAYNNNIRINDIIWQEYKDIDETADEIYLVHGSRSGIKGDIKLDVSGESNDFSNGFYCGTNLSQAGMFVAEEENSSLYIISFNPKGLKAARFRVDTDWMLAVAYFRGTINKYKDNPKVKAIVSRINKCDYVIAPIADNRMFETIDAFTEGTITDKQCLYALSTINLGHQYVFKKEKTLQNLDIVEHLYLCDAEKTNYKLLANIEGNTSLNKALLAKKRFVNVGKYIDELLVEPDDN